MERGIYLLCGIYCFHSPHLWGLPSGSAFFGGAGPLNLRKIIMTPTLPPPKKKPDNMKWGAVLKLAIAAGFSEWQTRILINFPGSPCRKELPPPMRPMYDRSKVLEVLGITE